MSRFVKNVTWGVRWGLLFAAIYSAWAVVILMVGGSAPFAKYGTTFGGIVAIYFVGGAAAGAIVGVLRPLARWRAGAAAVGILAATPIYIATTLLLEGPGWFALSRTQVARVIFSWALFAVLGGSMSGLILHQIFSDEQPPGEAK